MPPLGGESPVDLYHGVILADLPSGWWRLETASPLDDSSGNTNTLTAVGAPTSAAALIYGGNGRDFSGTAQAYTAVDSASLDLGDSFTLEVWIKPDSVTGTHTILSKGTNGYQLATVGTTFQLAKQGVAAILSTTGITLAIGTTYHVVATKNGAASAKIYVNGVDRSGTVTNQTCADTATALNIARLSDATIYVDGVLDEVAVYPYPMTASMVLTHYNAGLGTFGLNQLGTSGVGKQPNVKVEIAFASLWNAAYPLWDDVTSDLRSAQGLSLVLSGRADETQRPSPGSGKVTLDCRSRQYDPTYTSGPHGANVRPHRQIRIRAGWTSSDALASLVPIDSLDPGNSLFPSSGQIAGTPNVYWLLKGWVASWPVTSIDLGKDVTVTLEVIDWFAKLAGVEFPLGTAFSAQLAGNRIAACLDLLSIPASLRNIDHGISTVPALTNPTGSILDHILACADSDGGFFYSGSDGRATYETRTYRFITEATPRATFGDGGGAELPYSQIVPSSDDAYLFTEAQVATGDGTGTATAADAGAVLEYSPITFTRTLLTGFNEAQAAAEWYVSRFREPDVRFLSVQLKGAMLPATLWPKILGAYNSNRFMFVRRPLGGGTMTQDAFVERISHEIKGGAWQTTWMLSPHGDEDPWILGTDVLGTGTTPTW